MRVTRRLLVFRFAWTAVLLCALLAGCSDPAGPSSGSDGRSGETEIPAAIDEILARDNIKLTESTFDSGVSPADVLEAFSREYPGMSERQPIVYAAEIVSSDESRLKPGTPVRVAHVAGVAQEVTPPSPEPGREETTPFVIETDMFVFFSADTGAHLATVYIGPPA